MGDGVMGGGLGDGVMGGGLGDGVGKEGVMGDGVVGGGCYGGWCCGRRVLWGMVLWEEGVMGDGVVGGGCWGMVLWEEGMVLWTTLQNQLTFFRSDFWGLFSPLPSLSPISSFSYLNSVYMYMCTSPSSPLAPSDVSSPLVVMATSSSITVTGGLSSPAGGPQTTIFNVQALQMTLQTVVTGLQPVTTYLVYIYM